MDDFALISRSEDTLKLRSSEKSGHRGDENTPQIISAQGYLQGMHNELWVKLHKAIQSRRLYNWGVHPRVNPTYFSLNGEGQALKG